MYASRIPAALTAGVAICLFLLEKRTRLRQLQREPATVHTARNLCIAAMAGVVVGAIEKPIATRVADRTGRLGAGIVPRLTRSPSLRLVLSVVLLDYGLYLWHVLTHKVPFLWRFHLVHHIDLDLDASTALRFHFGEMLVSVPWRAAQIYLTGASPFAVSIWQTFLFCSILFHHSNLRPPLGVERWIRYLIMTPRLHGIHHRPELTCTDSNWSSGLAVWDLLHGTYYWREDDENGIGVPGYQEPGQVTLKKCVILPFRLEQDGFNRQPFRG